jgi:PncC family amidohydrolase
MTKAKKYELADEVGALLAASGLQIAVAESCTGGLLGHKITSVGGSSEYFLGGVIAYSNEIKNRVLGIGNDVIRREGAVSETVAIQMASAVRGRFMADIGVGITGVAGPSGGSEEKPVGLVYIALADGKRCRVCRFDIRGKQRNMVKETAASGALEMIRDFLKKEGEYYEQEDSDEGTI